MDNITLGKWGPSYPTKNGYKTSLQTFYIGANNRTIFLNRSLNRICSVRVHNISWLNNPLSNPNGTTKMWLSCDELYNSTTNQSSVFLINISDPSYQSPLILERSLIGTWVIAPVSSNVINPNYNDPQREFLLSKETTINQLTFLLEADGEPGFAVTIGPSHFLSITLEFCLCC
jgi:hypothetical protein